jgi:hypothetical protein
VTSDRLYLFGFKGSVEKLGYLLPDSDVFTQIGTVALDIVLKPVQFVVYLCPELAYVLFGLKMLSTDFFVEAIPF